MMVSFNYSCTNPTSKPITLPTTPSKPILNVIENVKQKFNQEATKENDTYKDTDTITTSSKADRASASALNNDLRGALNGSKFQEGEALGKKLSAIASKQAYGKEVKLSATQTEQEDIIVDKVKISIKSKFLFIYSNKGKETIKYKSSLSVLLNGKKIKSAQDLTAAQKKALPEAVLKQLES